MTQSIQKHQIWVVLLYGCMPLIGVLTSLVIVSFAVFVFTCIALMIVDIKEQNLPNQLTLSAWLCCLVLFVMAGQSVPLVWAVVMSTLSYLVYWYVYTYGGWIGGGDLKLAALIGLCVGWISPIAAVVTVGLAFVFGVAVLAFVSRRIPFAPYMVSGAALSLVLLH